MKQSHGWVVILLGALIICFTSCTKQYTAPPQWDVNISHKVTATGVELTGAALSTKSTNLRYVWHVSKVALNGQDEWLPAVRYEGKSIVANQVHPRVYVQLTVLDEVGNSVSEYLTVNR